MPSEPPPIWLQIAEDLEEYSRSATVARIDDSMAYLADHEQRVRDRKAAAESKRRATRAAAERRRRDLQSAIDEMLREDGGTEQVCGCGCGRVFIPSSGPGRPQLYATLGCKWRACKRAWRARVVEAISAAACIL